MFSMFGVDYLLYAEGTFYPPLKPPLPYSILTAAYRLSKCGREKKNDDIFQSNIWTTTK